jgi:hypothetical protein
MSSAAGGGVATRPDIREAIVPIETTFDVTIVLPNDDPNRPMKPGMVGKVKIAYGESRRLWEIIYFKARQNIRKSFGV